MAGHRPLTSPVIDPPPGARLGLDTANLKGCAVAEELSLFGAMLGEPGGQLGRLLEGMFTAQVAAAMTRLGVPDQLAGGPLTAAELAPRVGASADGLERMLTAAAAYGLVSQDGAGRYSLTPVGAALRADAANSAQDFAVGFLAPPMWASIGRLADVVRNPEPVNPAAPGGVYAYYAEHPEESAYFELEAIIGSAGYHLVRDTPVTDVLPRRVLEFERD